MPKLVSGKLIKWVIEESDDLMWKMDNPIRTLNCLEVKWLVFILIEQLGKCLDTIQNYKKFIYIRNLAYSCIYFSCGCLYCYTFENTYAYEKGF